jgi:hypothetical protein
VKFRLKQGALLPKPADLCEHRSGDEGINKSLSEAGESPLWPDLVNLL